MLQKGSLAVPRTDFDAVRLGDGVATISRTTSGNANIGTFQTMLNAPYGKYVPGQFQIRPNVLSKIVGASTPCNVKIPFLDGYTPYEFRVKGDLAAGFESAISIPAVPYLHPDVSINRALAQLNKPATDVGLMIGELTETIHMLRHPLSSLYPLVNRLRNKSFGKRPPRIGTKVVPSFWLEYQYGILPLLEDIESIRNMFDAKCVRAIEPLRRVKASSTESSSISVDAVKRAPYCTVYVQGGATSSIKITDHIYYKLNDWGRNYESLTGLGLNPFQLVDVAWAVTPYSFVVDWFVGIGKWLKAIQPHPHLDIIGGCTTVKTTETKSLMAFGLTCDLVYPTVNVYPNSSYTYTKTTLTRMVRTNFTPVAPNWGPGIRSLGQAISSAAMLYQRIPLHW